MTRRAERSCGAAGNIRQTIEYTCSPVSLGNLLERLGLPGDISERNLARLCGTTVEGTTTAGLIRAATEYGLRVDVCRRLNVEALASLGGPALVSISTIPAVRHATLFLRFDGDRALFMDPAYGRRDIGIDRFRKIWYGKTLVFRNTTGN